MGVCTCLGAVEEGNIAVRGNDMLPSNNLSRSTQAAPSYLHESEQLFGELLSKLELVDSIPHDVQVLDALIE